MEISLNFHIERDGVRQIVKGIDRRRSRQVRSLRSKVRNVGAMPLMQLTLIFAPAKKKHKFAFVSRDAEYTFNARKDLTDAIYTGTNKT